MFSLALADAADSASCTECVSLQRIIATLFPSSIVNSLVMALIHYVEFFKLETVQHEFCNYLTKHMYFNECSVVCSLTKHNSSHDS